MDAATHPCPQENPYTKEPLVVKYSEIVIVRVFQTGSDELD